jgi:hypothetical protein
VVGVDDPRVGGGERFGAQVPLGRPGELLGVDAGGLAHAGVADVAGVREQRGVAVLAQPGLARRRAVRVRELVAEGGPGIDVDEHVGEVDLGQLGPLDPGQPPHVQMPIEHVDGDLTIGEHPVERRDSLLDVGGELLEARVGARGQAEQAAVAIAAGGPGGRGDEVAVGGLVTARALHPDGAGAQRRAQLRQQAQLPRAALEPPVSVDDVRAPAGRHESGRRGVGQRAPAGGVQLAQQLDRVQQRPRGGDAMEEQRGQQRGGEAPQVRVAGRELLEVVVVERAMWRACSRAAAHRAGGIARHARWRSSSSATESSSRQPDEQIEQRDLLVGRGRRLGLELLEIAPGAAVGLADRLVGAVEHLVGQARELLLAEAQQRRVAQPVGPPGQRRRARAASQRGELPPPIRRHRVQSPALGAELAQIGELVELFDDLRRARRGRLAPEPDEPADAESHVGHAQPVQRPPRRAVEQRVQALKGLALGARAEATSRSSVDSAGRSSWPSRSVSTAARSSPSGESCSSARSTSRFSSASRSSPRASRNRASRAAP